MVTHKAREIFMKNIYMVLALVAVNSVCAMSDKIAESSVNNTNIKAGRRITLPSSQSAPKIMIATKKATLSPSEKRKVISKFGKFSTSSAGATSPEAAYASQEIEGVLAKVVVPDAMNVPYQRPSSPRPEAIMVTSLKNFSNKKLSASTPSLKTIPEAE